MLPFSCAKRFYSDQLLTFFLLWSSLAEGKASSHTHAHMREKDRYDVLYVLRLQESSGNDGEVARAQHLGKAEGRSVPVGGCSFVQLLIGR